jgi:putative transposase
VSDRRKLAPLFAKRGISRSRMCRLLGISRRRLAYQSLKRDDPLAVRLRDLARACPRFGARRLHAMLRREGWIVNLKRIRRLCKKEGLTLKRRIRGKRRGPGMGMPCRAEYPNHVWTYDFMEDRCENGRKLRILTVVDEFTRKCLLARVEHRMNAREVARTLLELFEKHGVPRFIRSDNGSEFIARVLVQILKIWGVGPIHIDPGSPWQNGIGERFNGTLRDECLNLETFGSLLEAKVIIGGYVEWYNAIRPHSSLSGMTPNGFERNWNREQAKAAPWGLRPQTPAPDPTGNPPACRSVREKMRESRMFLENESQYLAKT